MLEVILPQDQWRPEREWILSIILKEWAGVSYAITYQPDATQVVLRHSTQELSWPDSLFSTIKTPLTTTPLNIADYENDILGYCFLVLSRQEEWTSRAYDQHGRFSSKNITNRQVTVPVVDEKFQVIRNWLIHQQLMPAIAHAHPFRMSCDVDWPMKALRPIGMKAQLSSLLIKLRDGDLRAFVKEVAWLLTLKNSALDPYWNFGWMEQLSSELRTKWDFYFICRDQAAAIDGNYTYTDPRIQKLAQGLAERGHRLGIHGSYETYQNLKLLKEEKKNLETILGTSAKISRQHYLRWDIKTPRLLAEAGFEEDASMGFAETWGFRAGTSRTYSWFDLEQRQALPLKIQPLILMDTTLLGSQYLNLGLQEAAQFVEKILRRSREEGASYTLLLHNHFFERTIFRKFWRKGLKSYVK